MALRRQDPPRGQLQENGQYLDTAESKVFPTLPIREVARFLAMRDTIDETELVRAFRSWVRSHFKLEGSPPPDPRT
jgi:hypothetical protein